MAFAVRAVPQIFFVGEKFPERWDRWLRYLSYAFICSIISITLFISGGRFESAAAPRRLMALVVTILVAYETRSAVTGMITGVVVILILSWLFC